MSNPDAPNSGNSGDVLSSLPSTRPQRRSPKRDGAKRPKPPAKTASATSGRAANRGAAKAGAANAAGPKAGASAKSRPQATAPRRQGTGPRSTVAAQGYQSVSETKPVEPPTGAEILASAVQAAGDAARFGLTIGERLVRAAASRLPKP